jgi:hypothetical protein
MGAHIGEQRLVFDQTIRRFDRRSAIDSGCFELGH